MATSAAATADARADLRTWTAHADSWEVEGRSRAAVGGDAGELPGIRLMCSGLRSPAYNNGDVVDPALVDLERVRDWYAERGVPWGVRVPVGVPWTAGHRLLEKRLMSLDLRSLRTPPPVPGLSLRTATAADLPAVHAVDVAAFAGHEHEDAPEQEDDVGRAWLLPHLTAPQVEVALATLDGVPVATAYCVRTVGRAGPAAGLGGVAVLPEVRRRGIAAALSWELLRRAADAGARWAHLSPDTETAARVYSRLGFGERRGFATHVDA